MGRLARGVAAGAVDTTALNVATYLDMAIRGRPSSGVPAEAAERLASRAGVSLGDGEEVEKVVPHLAYGAATVLAFDASAG
jgi:hypothetical protein